MLGERLQIQFELIVIISCLAKFDGKKKKKEDENPLLFFKGKKKP